MWEEKRKYHEDEIVYIECDSKKVWKILETVLEKKKKN